MDHTPNGINASITALLNHIQGLEALLHKGAKLSPVQPSFHFTCRVGVKAAKVDQVLSTNHTVCLPTQTTSAHARMGVESLVPVFDVHLKAIQDNLSELALAFIGTPGLTSTFSMGVDITEQDAFGWFNPTHRGSLKNACPGTGHGISNGAFADAVRVVANADGWRTGPTWTMLLNSDKHFYAQADCAATALQQVWAIHEPNLFDPARHDSSGLAHIAPIESDIRSILARSQAALPHRHTQP